MDFPVCLSVGGADDMPHQLTPASTLILDHHADIDVINDDKLFTAFQICLRLFVFIDVL